MELTKRRASRSGRAEDRAARAAACSLLAERPSRGTIFAIARPAVAASIDGWSKRCCEQNALRGCIAVTAGKRASVLTPRLEARILDWTLKRKPPDRVDAVEHAQARSGAGDLAHDAWRGSGRKHALQPHRFERYMASNDPDFEAKAADVIGLYLNPPQHAAVFCVDEKTAIQALDRIGSGAAAVAGACRAARLRVLPPRHAVAVRGLRTPRPAKCSARPRRATPSAEFVAFLTDIVATSRKARRFT